MGGRHIALPFILQIMERYRVGQLESLILGPGEYVIEKKRWFGLWTNWASYSSRKRVIEAGKRLEAMGHWVEWYL